MRDINTVLDALIAHFTDIVGAPVATIHDRRVLLTRLEKVRGHIPYTPPEVMQEQWGILTAAVNYYFRGLDPNGEWEEKFVELWMGKPLGEVLRKTGESA